MALTHSTAARNAAANAVVDLLDVGSGANGTLVFLTSGDVVVSTLALTAKGTGAFQDAVNGVATARAIATDSAAVGGVVAKFQLRDCNGATVISGTVATSGGDITGSEMVVGAGAAVAINALTYTAPV